VTFDNVGGARQAVDHLVRMGHRRIAFLQGPPENYDAVLREEGMKQAMRAAGLEQPAALRWAGDYSEESGNAAVVAFLKTGAPLPDAIFACNDSMAIGALVALQERGLRVPEDVALVGFDDIASARHLGLTSVRIPMRDLGRAAAELAIALSQGQKPKKELIEMPTEVVVRRSCGAGRGRPAQI
jgi:LacI family transcriptional regulator